MALTHPGTLTADQAVTVEIDNHGGWVEVVNRSQTGEIWVRVDGEDATVAGEDCYLVLGSRRLAVPVAVTLYQAAAVSLIASDALDYTVEAGG